MKTFTPSGGGQPRGLNEAVRDYWEAEPCGTGPGAAPPPGADRLAWFEAIEERRYRLEPFIYSAAQFTRHHGQRVLEVGVGVGTDHLQWARAGAVCHGVDLTEAAIQLTREHLSLYGFASDLQVADAEALPYPDASFDVVYSWGVVHHAEHPDLVLREIHRVLRPGGAFIGMLYGRRSLVAVKLWLKHALLRLHPRTTLAQVIWTHMESVGTKAYTVPELMALLADFEAVRLHQTATPYDRDRLPRWIGQALPDHLGWFIVVRATRGG